MRKRTVAIDFYDSEGGLDDLGLAAFALHFLRGNYPLAGHGARGLENWGKTANARVIPTSEPQGLAVGADIHVHLAPPPAGFVQEVSKVGEVLSIVTRSA
jgi:hypothetical protein